VHVEVIPDIRALATQAVGFILVVIVFWRYLWGPIQGIIDARRDEVEGHYSAAEEARKAAAELKADYEKHLANAEAEMRAKITEAAKEGQALREEIVAESRKQAEQVLARAQDEIGREKDKAVLEIKTRVADLAVTAAGKLIEESLDDPKHRQLVDKFIDDLEGAAK
jgi:F-type H+-transporting ATPase subunit b